MKLLFQESLRVSSVILKINIKIVGRKKFN